MIAEEIKKIAKERFEPSHCEVLNESRLHCGPATETHFKLTLVSEAFAEKNRVQRHRMVYFQLTNVVQKIHALALHLYTPGEWLALSGKSPESPSCEGGAEKT